MSGEKSVKKRQKSKIPGKHRRDYTANLIYYIYIYRYRKNFVAAQRFPLFDGGIVRRRDHAGSTQLALLRRSRMVFTSDDPKTKEL